MEFRFTDSIFYGFLRNVLRIPFTTFFFFCSETSSFVHQECCESGKNWFRYIKEIDILSNRPPRPHERKQKKKPQSTEANPASIDSMKENPLAVGDREEANTQQQPDNGEQPQQLPQQFPQQKTQQPQQEVVLNPPFCPVPASKPPTRDSSAILKAMIGLSAHQAEDLNPDEDLNDGHLDEDVITKTRDGSHLALRSFLVAGNSPESTTNSSQCFLSSFVGKDKSAGGQAANLSERTSLRIGQQPPPPSGPPPRAPSFPDDGRSSSHRIKRNSSHSGPNNFHPNEENPSSSSRFPGSSKTNNVEEHNAENSKAEENSEEGTHRKTTGRNLKESDIVEKEDQEAKKRKEEKRKEERSRKKKENQERHKNESGNTGGYVTSDDDSDDSSNDSNKPAHSYFAPMSQVASHFHHQMQGGNSVSTVSAAGHHCVVQGVIGKGIHPGVVVPHHPGAVVGPLGPIGPTTHLNPTHHHVSMPTTHQGLLHGGGPTSHHQIHPLTHGPHQHHLHHLGGPLGGGHPGGGPGVPPSFFVSPVSPPFHPHPHHHHHHHQHAAQLHAGLPGGPLPGGQHHAPVPYGVGGHVVAQHSLGGPHHAQPPHHAPHHGAPFQQHPHVPTTQQHPLAHHPSLSQQHPAFHVVGGLHSAPNHALHHTSGLLPNHGLHTNHVGSQIQPQHGGQQPQHVGQGQQQHGGQQPQQHGQPQQMAPHNHPTQRVVGIMTSQGTTSQQGSSYPAQQVGQQHISVGLQGQHAASSSVPGQQGYQRGGVSSCPTIQVGSGQPQVGPPTGQGSEGGNNAQIGRGNNAQIGFALASSAAGTAAAAAAGITTAGDRQRGGGPCPSVAAEGGQAKGQGGQRSSSRQHHTTSSVTTSSTSTTAILGAAGCAPQPGVGQNGGVGKVQNTPLGNGVVGKETAGVVVAESVAGGEQIGGNTSHHFPSVISSSFPSANGATSHTTLNASSTHNTTNNGRSGPSGRAAATNNALPKAGPQIQPDSGTQDSCSTLNNESTLTGQPNPANNVSSTALINETRDDEKPLLPSRQEGEATGPGKMTATTASSQISRGVEANPQSSSVSHPQENTTIANTTTANMDPAGGAFPCTTTTTSAPGGSSSFPTTSSFPTSLKGVELGKYSDEPSEISRETSGGNSAKKTGVLRPSPEETPSLVTAAATASRPPSHSCSFPGSSAVKAAASGAVSLPGGGSAGPARSFSTSLAGASGASQAGASGAAAPVVVVTECFEKKKKKFAHSVMTTTVTTTGTTGTTGTTALANHLSSQHPNNPMSSLPYSTHFPQHISHHHVPHHHLPHHGPPGHQSISHPGGPAAPHSHSTYSVPQSQSAALMHGPNGPPQDGIGLLGGKDGKGRK